MKTTSPKATNVQLAKAAGVKEVVLGRSDLETLEKQIERLKKTRETARGFYDLAAGMVVNEELAGRGGMAFMLMPDAHHTGKDVEQAAAFLRANRDVVSICYVRLESFQPAQADGEPDVTAEKKVEELVAGDRVDLGSCPFLNAHPTASFEFAEVVSVGRETEGCVAVEYEGIDVIGYKAGQTLKVRVVPAFAVV